MSGSGGADAAIDELVEGFEPWDGPAGGVTGGDPLGWPGYPDVLARARDRSGAVESVVTGVGHVRGAPDAAPVAVIAGVFDFVGGSLGLAAGERVVRAYHRAADERLAVLVLARSGGARMQEGMVALVQMARTAAAARRHSDAGLLQVAWLDSPTTGGVYASFASLADVLWAPPGAVIGFAGPRVVEQTTGEALPEGAHRAESAAAAGIIDAVLEPADARAALATLLAVTSLGDPSPPGAAGAPARAGGTGTGPGGGTGDRPGDGPSRTTGAPGADGTSGTGGAPGVHGTSGTGGAPGVHGTSGTGGAPGVHGTGVTGVTGGTGGTGGDDRTEGAGGTGGTAGSARPTGTDPARAAADAWAEVQRARDPRRASGRAWLDRLVPRRVALVGDRAGGIDPVVGCGLGLTPRGTAVAYAALDRHTLDGRPRPAGYRTARRAFELAARLGLPVLTLVDTPGADPRDPSERAGLAGEIARTLAALGAHPAPTVSLVLGEGGSGGALAFAATDRCYLLDGAVFSVIGPEGAAAILERDAGRAAELAPRLRLTGPDLVGLGIVDAVLPADSPDGEAADDVAAVIEGALAGARPGDGIARLDSATHRWLNEEP